MSAHLTKDHGTRFPSFLAETDYEVTGGGIVTIMERRKLIVAQVLYKRKPVQYLPRPVIEDDSSEVGYSVVVTHGKLPVDTFCFFCQVWVIPETNEVFTSYEPYLQRMDFYKSRRFICEITGHSGMTFFEALRSEVGGNIQGTPRTCADCLGKAGRIARGQQQLPGSAEGADSASHSVLDDVKS